MLLSYGYHVSVQIFKGMDYQWNRNQDKYNQVWYKGENQNCVYWPIIGSYNNWKIIHCIDSIKKESTDNDRNVPINQNTTRDIDLKIGKDISDND